MSLQTPPGTRSPLRARIWIVLGLFACVTCAMYCFSRSNVEELVAQARNSHTSNDFDSALRFAELALSQDRNNHSAIVAAGDACFGLEDYDRALDYYKQVDQEPSEEWIHACERCGRIQMHHLGNATAAEAHFRQVLAHEPNHRPTLIQLTSLLGIEARRREAVPLILRLFQQGEFHEDYLSLLQSDDAALNNIQELDRYHEASPSDPGVLVGLAWHARRAKAQEKSLEQLRRALSIDPKMTEARVALADLLWHLGRVDELQNLLGEEPSRSIRSDSRLWVIRGRLAESTQQIPAASRCYWEAIKHDPANSHATYKMYRFASEHEQVNAAKLLKDRVLQLDRLREQTVAIASRSHTDWKSVEKLIGQLQIVGRYWEAWGWSKYVVKNAPKQNWARIYESRLRSRLKDLSTDHLCVPISRLDLDLSHLSLPTWKSHAVHSRPAVSPNPELVGVTFRDDAKSLGIEHQHVCGKKLPDGLRMYQLNGGGCAALDYDGDGWPDLHFTQGCQWPVDRTAFDELDRLYRNDGGRHFFDVTSNARISENGFSTGVAVSDFNADGFDDLYVANIGANRLLQNNGDGTFSDVTELTDVEDSGWSTSCVFADLNNDGLPDVYSVNYLEGPAIFDTVCEHKDGKPRMCMPFHFPGAQDQLYVNLGDGRFENVTEQTGIEAANGKGLGVVAADWNGDGRLGLFVANDTVANFYFVNEGNSPDGLPKFVERGMPLGAAFNGDGKPEACMGIAIGDADEDGDLDMFVTNFYSESNTLYHMTSESSFDDATRQCGLVAPSRSMLGFGTQFLDADLDGRLDLLVANGHIDDYQPYGRPYKMPAQFFRNTGRGRFVDASSNAGGYFARKLRGRGVTRVDWNRDGREDAVIIDMDEPSAILTNTTDSVRNHLVIRLRGVVSSRDAIGTTVTVHAGGKVITRQLTAGDGYQASNERVLVFGLSNADEIDSVAVKWPSGLSSSYTNLQTSAAYMLIEGRHQAYELP